MVDNDLSIEIRAHDRFTVPAQKIVASGDALAATLAKSQKRL
jgi:hypothetical protein